MIYILSKLFTYIFLPPGAFIATFFASSFFVKRYKKIFFTISIIFWFLSTDFSPYILLYPLENMRFEKEKKDLVAVVVLGGGKESGALSFPTKAGATERLLKALIVAHKNDLPLVYSGFENIYAKRTLEEINRGFGLGYKFENRLKPKNILIEKDSKNSYQNGFFTKKLFEKLGVKNPHIFLVTSAYHMPRSYKIFRYFGFRVYPIKTDYKIDKNFDFWSIFPKMENLKNSYIAIHEYFGIASLYLRGIY